MDSLSSPSSFSRCVIYVARLFAPSSATCLLAITSLKTLPYHICSCCLQNILVKYAWIPRDCGQFHFWFSAQNVNRKKMYMVAKNKKIKWNSGVLLHTINLGKINVAWFNASNRCAASVWFLLWKRSLSIFITRILRIFKKSNKKPKWVSRNVILILQSDIPFIRDCKTSNTF